MTTTNSIESIIAHQQDLLKESFSELACLFNLIVYSPEPKREEDLWKYVETVTDKFPCRVIFVHYSAALEPEHLEIKVNSHTNETEERHSDQIYIQTGTQQLERVPFLLYPLIVPDLPIFLLWGQDPTLDHVILPKLQKDATRLIFDSGCTQNLHLYSERMLSLMQSVDVDVIDLNWAFSGGWRQILARVFDSPQKLSQLKNAQHIVITFNGALTESSKNSGIQAIYLQAWLATQLGLRFISIKIHQHIDLLYQNESQEVRVILTPKESEDVSPGAIMSIEIDTSESSYSLCKAPNQPRVTVHVSSREQCEMPYSFPLLNFQRGFTFVNEVFYQPTSFAYQTMLRTISKIEWKN